MSHNPQWKSFQPPSQILNSDTSIIDYKPLQNNSAASNFHRSSSGYSNNYQSPTNMKDMTNNVYPNSSTNNFSPSNYNVYSPGNNSRFPIGTFNSTDADIFSNGESLSSPSNTSNNIFSNSPSSNNSNSSYTDSSLNNQGTRETGIIEKLLHSYGFIQCCERQARLFFHFSQFSGNIEHLKIGDPVEFEMTYDRRTGKPIASTVTKIAPEVVLSEERVTGTVTTELRKEGSGGETQGRISYENRGECFFLPYTKDDVEGNVTLQSGDKVSFQIATNQRGNLGASHVRLENPVHPVKYQGVVCSMKDSFGFIERADVVKEIFFHFSEVKVKDELQLGEDVEFIIQTRNSKEVACNITRLPSGTVVFEDIAPEIVKGQVLKPVERGNTTRHQSDPLSGRIRYRAPDHSEVEIPFGDKDQKGEFTLRHGDWVEFKIATDRRDQLDRASTISLLPESFLVSGEKREQGTIASLKDNYGFLKCVERGQKIYFNFSEILGSNKDLAVNDEVEFTVIQDFSLNYNNSNNRQSAIRIKNLPKGTVHFEILKESSVVGTVTKEAPLFTYSQRSPTKSNNQVNSTNNEKFTEYGIITYLANDYKESINYYLKDCDVKSLPRIGDKVEFNICVVRSNKELIATNVVVIKSNNPPNHKNGINNLPLCQGFIAALKDGFGFIETLEHDSEVFFHFSNVDGDSSTLELGMEVEYVVGIRTSSGGSCQSAENVKMLPKGTINQNITIGEDVLSGKVVRPLRSVNPDQEVYAGLIQADTEAENEKGDEYEFGITSLTNKRELLQVDDPVQFQVDSNGRAANVQANRKKRKATVDAIKGAFGFLTYEVEEGKKLFFHTTEVKDSVILQQGDQVEFVLVVNQRTGKSSACNVTKISASEPQQRPERLISRLRTVSLDDGGPKLTVLRQPRGPDGTKGFSLEFRTPRIPGVLIE